MRLLIFSIICILALSACKKEDNYIHAVVIDGGDIAVDGCGWLLVLELNSVTCKPVNLHDDFKIDGLEVAISYTLLDSKADCGFAQDVHNEISLQHINIITE